MAEQPRPDFVRRAAIPPMALTATHVAAEDDVVRVERVAPVKSTAVHEWPEGVKGVKGDGCEDCGA